jgi:membrane associated rhomboid family serine protease
VRKSGPLFSYVVYALVAVNAIMFLLQHLISPLTLFLALTPIDVGGYSLLVGAPVAVMEGAVWQLVSYMFLHGGFMHILFNMYVLVMFGLPVEMIWGRRRFLLYYLFCGTGAGLVIFLIALLTGSPMPTVGASGALFGVMLAFSVLYPNAEVLLFFFLPVKAKYLIIIYAGFELYMEMSGSQPNVSHVGHLGGLVSGILFLVLFGKEGSRPMGKFRRTVSANEKKLEREREAGRAGVRERILLKLRAGGGKESLDDEEWQYVHYLDIISSSGSVNPEEAVFIAEVRRMMEL